MKSCLRVSPNVIAIIITIDFIVVIIIVVGMTRSISWYLDM